MEPDYPPLRIADRSGRVTGHEAPAYELYEQLGQLMRQHVLEALPEDWSFAGKRVLDFGCSAGRVIRHFTAEAAEAEFVGCDIDDEAVSWAQAHLSPPFSFFHSGDWPPLPLEDESFDLIYAMSVFTHLNENWSAWMLELHRILRPGGLLFATFLNRGIAAEFDELPWDEDRIGMHVIRAGAPWDQGGPIVFHSQWWIEEHWGRAFDVLTLRRAGGTDERPTGQGHALLRKKPLTLTTEELERASPSDSREIEALRHNIRRLHREEKELRENYEDSRSWRVTRPLRRLAAEVHRRRSG